MATRPALILSLMCAALCVPVTFPVESAPAQRTDCPMVDCEDSDVVRGGSHGTFRGLYTLGFEMSEFVPSGSNCRWWLAGDTEPLWMATDAPQGMDSATVRIEVEGVVSDPGCFGHMGVYRRQLTVTRIIAADVRTADGQGWTHLSLPVFPTPSPPGLLPPEKLRR
jgi:hypothetical protein